MRRVTAYLMDGRGQPTDGRRSVTPGPVVPDDLHDAVEVEPVLDAEWTEKGELPRRAPRRRAQAGAGQDAGVERSLRRVHVVAA